MYIDLSLRKIGLDISQKLMCWQPIRYVRSSQCSEPIGSKHVNIYASETGSTGTLFSSPHCNVGLFQVSN